MIQRPHEFGDGILREDESAPAEHVVAGVEKNKDVGAGHSGLDILRSADYLTRGRIAPKLVAYRGTGGSPQILRAFVAFLKRGELLGDAVLGNLKVRRMQIGDVVSLFVRHGHVQLNHGNHDANYATGGFL